MAVILFIFIIFPCHCAVYMYKIMILQKPLSQFQPNFALIALIVYSNDYAPLTVRPIYSSSKLRTAQMMIFSLVAMIGLEKCCITSAYLQWSCHSGEQVVAHGPLVFIFNLDFFRALILQKCIGSMYLLPATPPTVLGQSFSNFKGAFRMVWRYAYCFFRVLKLFFITFCSFLT